MNHTDGFLPSISPEALEAAWQFLAGLTPGAIGSAVGVAFEKGQTWGQRFLQLAVGIVVSYFARGIGQHFHLDDFVLQGISFTAGMIAFKAVPGFIKSSSETIANIPKDLWAWVKARLGIPS